MPPRIQIIQRIENNIETLEPIDVELRVCDIGMMSFELDVGIEPCGALFRNLKVDQRRESMPKEKMNEYLTKAFDFLMCSCLKRN